MLITYAYRTNVLGLRSKEGSIILNQIRCPLRSYEDHYILINFNIVLSVYNVWLF